MRELRKPPPPLWIALPRPSFHLHSYSPVYLYSIIFRREAHYYGVMTYLCENEMLTGMELKCSLAVSCLDFTFRSILSDAKNCIKILSFRALELYFGLGTKQKTTEQWILKYLLIKYIWKQFKYLLDFQFDVLQHFLVGFQFICSLIITVQSSKFQIKATS